MRRAYDALVAELLDAGVVEENVRTGRLIKALPPRSFTVSGCGENVPVPGNRRVYPGTAAAEVAWFLLGSRDVTWLRQYTRIWDGFVEDDGVTVDAAYGYRWAHHFGRDQLAQAVQALRTDPSNRRVWVTAWDPAADGLDAKGQRNVPCPVGFALSVLGGALNMSLFVRSSDVFVGLPYDVMGHRILQVLIARSLGRSVGDLHVTLAHPHLYEPHWGDAELGLQTSMGFERPAIPDGWTLGTVTNRPDRFVQEMRDAAREVRWPDFNPRPEVVL